MFLTIIFYFLTLVLLITTASILFTLFIRKSALKKIDQHTSLINQKKNTSLNEPRKPRVTKYRWIPGERACAASLERAHWKPLDIIDWMAQGLPRTPEMNKICGQNCRCRLLAVPREAKNTRPPRSN